MASNQLDSIVSNIRSCLISTKGRITLRQLEDDYRTILGQRIPFSKLGYKTLEAFLRTIPSINVTRYENGEVLVDAKVSEKSAHISSMVRSQKSTAKRRVRIAPSFQKATHPPPTTPRWRPKNHVLAKPSRSPRLEDMSHKQFVGRRHNASKNAVVHRPEACSVSAKLEESPITNTMHRISKLMTEADRDSGNSSPTEYEQARDFSRSGDPIQDIRSFVQHHKLGEVVAKFTETKQKKAKQVQWHCIITVDQHKYSSYPNDFFDKVAAERHAAQKALDDLTPKYCNKRRSLLLSSNDDIIARIPPMLEKHNSTVWMWQIEADYIDKYNEQLPTDWLQVIDSSAHVSIEKCHGGYVLRYCNPNDVLQKGKKKPETTLSVSDVSVPCNTVTFGDNSRVYAVVTVALSSDEIWCQQCGTPDYEVFVKMNEAMENYYNKNRSQLHVKDINFGSCYVIEHEGGWVRVRALAQNEDGAIDCFLIDYGEQMPIQKDHIFMLRREFAMEQAQAFVCRLDGLEEFFEASQNSEHLSALVGKEFVLEFAEETSGDDIPAVVMYDVTTNASINEELISLLTFESAMPVLNESVITEVYICNIEANGDIYVQIRTFGYHRLQSLLKDLSQTCSTSPPLHLLTPRPSKANSPNKMYMCQDKQTFEWLRATIIDWAPEGALAQVYFTDIGRTQIVDTSKEQMFPLDKLDDIIAQMPAQAIRTRILLDSIPADFVERAEPLLPRDTPLLLRISRKDSDGVPLVEIFKRTTDGVLVFINKSIAVESELKNCGIAGTNNNDTRKRLMNLIQFGDGSSKTVPSGGSLRKPEIPKIGAYFNVNIPFAVNPWNFFVQPLDSFQKLKELMDDMQKYYQELQFSPIPIEDIVPGNIYASKHEDGCWYRTSVLKVIHSGSISVFYCDFGYYTNLTIAQLVPLNSKYMSFPYQALKAKIAGIKPIKNKWTMEDCDTFNGLVTKKHFVSIVVSIKKDEFYQSDSVLELLLVDTSNKEDINIKEVLINKGIAVSV